MQLFIQVVEQIGGLPMNSVLGKHLLLFFFKKAHNARRSQIFGNPRLIKAPAVADRPETFPN